MIAFETQLRRHQRGFTLIELMVSIALALLLVLGINAVFKMSADTVGMGMQVSEITRQLRTARTQLDNDFTHMAPRNTSPALILQMYNQPALRDKKDELAATSVKTGFQPPYDPDSNDIDATQSSILDVRDAEGNSIYTNTSRSSPAGTAIPARVYLPQILNDRNHRTDMMSFAVQNPLSMQRQTPNYGGFGNPMLATGATQYQGYFKSTDAWVSYGHVLQPDNSVNAENMLNFDKTSASPGGQTHFLGLGVNKDAYTGNLYTTTGTASGTMANPNNFYSTNWILGRIAMLMGDPSQLDAYPNPYSSSNTFTQLPQTYTMDPFQTKANGYQYPENTAQQAALRPLSWGSALNATTSTGAEVEIQTSQCDVAGLSMLSIHDKALNAQNPAGTGLYLPRWYLPLVAWGTGLSETGANTPTNPQLPSTPPAPAGTWVWPTTVTFTQLGLEPRHAFRYMAQAWPDKLGTNAGSLNGATKIPAMHQQLAVQTPVFWRGCSQFIVEYAGDYLQQVSDVNDTASLTPPNPNVPANPAKPLVGTVKGIGEDGQIDFDVTVDDSGGTPTFIKRIRWYGMTRSLDDGVSVEDTTTPFPTTPAGNPPGAPPTQSEIVRPLYRYIQNYTQSPTIANIGIPGTAPAQKLGGITNMPFEKLIGFTPAGGGQAIYAGFPDKPPTNVSSYTAAWGPLDMDLDQLPLKPPQGGDADPSLIALWPFLQKTGPQAAFPSRSLLPWMIRITVRLDDPAGRLPDGQTMQFIFNVPRPH